jgi:hypothetical protein
MNYKDFTDRLKMQVFNLPYARQLDFAITICKRMFFNYQKFYDQEQWGDPGLLMDAIEFAKKQKQ